MLFALFDMHLSAKEFIYYLLIMLFALVLSFSVHEFMHAYVAHKLGDDTAMHMGRLTLNPTAHLDPMGTILILLMGFGWGKPVPVNPNRLNRLKSRRAMNIMVDLAGVTGNFIVALISMLIVNIVGISAGFFDSASINTSNFYDVMLNDVNTTDNMAVLAICQIFAYTTIFSLMLLAFNLLPLPPLDGFNVMNELLPTRVRMSDGYRQYLALAPQILLILIIVGSFTRISVFGFLITKIAWPFAWVINRVCDLVSGIM